MPFIFPDSNIYPYTPTSVFNSTGSPLYETPLGVRITIKSLDKQTTYLTYDSFAPASGTIIFARVSTSLSNNGSFKIQFLDNDLSINTNQIKSPARVYIEVGKSSTTMTRIFSGMIRKHGRVKGFLTNILYNIEGFGTGIRRNERILDVNQIAKKKLEDGITIDQTDNEFRIDELADNTLDKTTFYPADITPNIKEGENGFEYIDTTTTQADSPIHDFIPSVLNRFDEIQDLHNIFEEYSGARIYIDEYDKLQVQPLLVPSRVNYGFIIKDVPDKTNDNGDNTLYIRDEFSFDFNYTKDFGYSSKLYSVLPSDPVPDVESSSASAFYENKTVEIAQRFKPPTNPNWRLFCAVEGVGMSNVDGEGSVRGRWRICADDNGKPLDSGGILANKYMPPNKFYNTSDGGRQVIQIMGEGNTDLDINTWYWLILSSVNSTGSVYWRWYHDNSTVNGISATAPPSTSSDSDGGSGWTVKNGPKMELQAIRFKSEPYEITDQKACDSNILIDSMLQSFPQQINTKIAATKYSVALMAKTARPKPIWNFPNLTVPNRIPFVGDIAIVQDSVLSLSTTGQPVSCGQITDLELSWGIEGGGSDPSSKGITSLSLNLVGYPLSY